MGMLSVGHSQTVKERLPDGSLVIEFEGTEYRALPPNQMREVLKRLGAYEVLQADYTTLQTDFNLFRQTTEKARITEAEKTALEFQKKDERILFFSGEHLAEKQLREKYEHILKGCTGKIVLFRLCIR